VLAFARKRGYPVERLVEATSVHRERPSWERMREWLYRHLLAGEADTVQDQLYGWLMAGVRLVHLYDHVVAPVLERIGSEWAAGKLSVAEEHLASNALQSALMGLRRRVRPLVPGLRRAVSAALGEEEHILGLLMATHVLEHAGFQVDFLGARTPVEELRAWFAKAPAELLCLSFVMPVSPEEAQSLLEPLQELRRQGVRLVAGGRAADPSWQTQGLVDGLYTSLQDLAEHLRA
jgi:methanogenic corrinoid protein MtbC1